MSSSPQQRTVALLERLPSGGKAVVDALVPLLYEELRALAHRQLQGERPNHTLNTTALVHEAYLKLVGQDDVSWQNRAHFLGVAALVMRRLLINHAQQHLAAKRGGGVAVLTLTDELIGESAKADELLALNDALDRLTAYDARQARVAECRFFGGLKEEEIAVALGVSVPTVRRDWRMARAWLARELR